MPPQKQVQFRSPLGGIVVGLAVAVSQEHLLERESLPACGVPGMTGEVAHAFQAEQVVQHPAVPQVDLGRFHHALRDVLGPGGEQPNHVRADQKVPVAVRRGRPDIERARDLRRVPALPVQMGHHPPAAADGFGRYARRDPRDVAFHEGLGERVHPVHPVGRRVRQERARKTAPEPETVGTVGPHLKQGEPAHSDESDPARQGFGDALHKAGRGAAEKHEDGLPIRIVAQGPQDLEDLRQSLHLVQHDEPPAAAQNPFRREGERLPVARLLQIEVFGRARPCVHELARDGGLADLACAENGDRG